MNKLAPVLLAALIVPGAAFAQQTGNDTSTATETQERYSEGQGDDFPIGLLGLLGLAGLLGLRKRSDTHTHVNR
jgi:MYXO-CTERM domain-containing protein